MLSSILKIKFTSPQYIQGKCATLFIAHLCIYRYLGTGTYKLHMYTYVYLSYLLGVLYLYKFKLWYNIFREHLIAVLLT